MRAVFAQVGRRLPGVVLALGAMLIASIAPASSQMSVGAVIAIVITCICVAFPHRDVFGLSVASVLGLAALTGSGGAFAVAALAVTIALILRVRVESRAFSGTVVWLVVGALCGALVLWPLDIGGGSEAEEATNSPVTTTTTSSPTTSTPTTTSPPSSETEPTLNQAEAIGRVKAIEDARQQVDLDLAFEQDINSRPSAEELATARALSEFYDGIRVQPDVGGPRALPQGREIGVDGDGSILPASWWWALLMFLMAIVSLRLFERTREISLVASPPRPIAEGYGADLERLAKRHGIARGPSESLLHLGERLSERTDDERYKQLSELISAETYGEPSPRRSALIDQLIERLG